jgi:hypothetical protein
MKAILVATIGTRDLMYQTSSGQWYNIGNDQMRADILTDQVEVSIDLGKEALSFRDLTEFLANHLDQYRERIRPVITGKLLKTHAADIDHVYLIGTDQLEAVPQRDKDTLFACQIFQDWFAQHYPHLHVDLISLGNEGTDPTDFEAMFRWWQDIWPQIVGEDSESPIWLCIKGGVGQTAESGRISGLSQYGDRIQFFEFQERRDKNIQGIPSDFTGPFSGTVYLWSRAKQQALQLLDRYDYAGAKDVLYPYYQRDSSGFGALPTWLEAGMAWQRGEFKQFYQRAKSTLPAPAQRQTQQWWWIAYEQAQLATIRLAQENTTEAMLHSFRTIEGTIWAWMATHIASHINHPPHRYPQLLASITTLYPTLDKLFKPRFPNEVQKVSVNLNNHTQQALIEVALPETAHSPDLQAFWSEENRTLRNTLSHQLGGISRLELLHAWGQDIHRIDDWQRRLLNGLNLLTGQTFKSLEHASLFTQVHQLARQKVEVYQP